MADPQGRILLRPKGAGHGEERRLETLFLPESVADTFSETKQSSLCVMLRSLPKVWEAFCLANHKSVHYRDASEICYTSPICFYQRNKKEFEALLWRTFTTKII